jgi:hypothetical protein
VRNKSLTLKTLLLAIAILPLAGLSHPALACMEPIDCPYWDCPIGPIGVGSGLASAGQTEITFLGPNRVQIAVGSYSTPSMPATYACSVALTPVDGIESVDRITMVDHATGQVLPNYSWVPSDAATGEFSTLVEDAGVMSPKQAQWSGFFTEVQGGSVGGIRHSFVIEATLAKGTTIKKLIAALREQGMLVNGSANFDGTLNFAHYYFRRLGDGPISVVFPGRRPEPQKPQRSLK